MRLNYNKRLILLLLIYYIIFSSNLFAVFTGYYILKIPSNPRGFSMGNSLNADVRGTDGLAYNPSGLYYFTKNYEFSVSYLKWILEAKYGSIGLVKKNVDKKYAIGGQFIYFDEGGIEDKRVYDIVGKIGIGYKLKKYLIVGSSISYVYRYVFEGTMEGVLFNIGSQFRFKNIKHFIFGVTINNIGFSSVLKYEKDILPTNISTGIRYIIKLDFINSKLKIYSNWEYFFYDRSNFNTGIEFIYDKIIYLRIGPNLNDSALYDKQKKISFGSGIKIDMGKVRYIIDFSIVPFVELGTGYYTGIKVSF